MTIQRNDIACASLHFESERVTLDKAKHRTFYSRPAFESSYAECITLDGDNITTEVRPIEQVTS